MSITSKRPVKRVRIRKDRLSAQAIQKVLRKARVLLNLRPSGEIQLLILGFGQLILGFRCPKLSQVAPSWIPMASRLSEMAKGIANGPVSSLSV